MVEETFCVRCKTKTNTRKPHLTMIRNKNKALKGICGVCGMKKSSFVKKNFVLKK